MPVSVAVYRVSSSLFRNARRQKVVASDSGLEITRVAAL
jgi:hypothetical protein